MATNQNKQLTFNIVTKRMQTQGEKMTIGISDNDNRNYKSHKEFNLSAFSIYDEVSVSPYKRRASPSTQARQIRIN